MATTGTQTSSSAGSKPGQNLLVADSARTGDIIGSVHTGIGCPTCFKIDGPGHAQAFAIDRYSGELSVNDAAALARLFANKPHQPVALAVTVADGTQTCTETVHIYRWRIQDVPVIELPETASKGFPVATLSVELSSAVFAEKPRFSFVSGNGEGVFALDAQSGNIVVDNPAKLNAGSSFNLSVEAEYCDVLKGIASTACKLLSVKVWGIAIGADVPAIPELAPSGFPVGPVRVVGIDPAKVSLALGSGNADGAFAIDGVGSITVANGTVLDFAKNPLRRVEVQATFAGSTLTRTLDIGLTLGPISYLKLVERAKGPSPSELRKSVLNFPVPSAPPASQQLIAEILRDKFK